MSTTISYPLKNERREAVRQLVDAFVSVWPDSAYGPAHIALDDYNLLDDNLEWCIRLTADVLIDSADEKYTDMYKGHSKAEIKATLDFLESLKSIPEEWRDIYDEAEDDEASAESVPSSGIMPVPGIDAEKFYEQYKDFRASNPNPKSDKWIERHHD